MLKTLVDVNLCDIINKCSKLVDCMLRHEESPRTAEQDAG